MSCLTFFRLIFAVIVLDSWANSQETNPVCRLLSNSSASISLNENFVISPTIVPTRQPGSNYSNAVAVTSLSSSLIGKYGDSFAVALIGISNQAVQWESVSETGSSSPLSEVKETFQSTSEIQFDNRFGLFHFDANFNVSFPENIVLLSPTDRIRFKISKELVGSSDFSSCFGQSVAFVFFDVGSGGSQVLPMVQSVKSQLVSLSCHKWPFSTLVFRICPDLRTDSGIFTSIPVKKTTLTVSTPQLSSLDTTLGDLQSTSNLQSTSDVVSTFISVSTTTEAPNTKITVTFVPVETTPPGKTVTFPQSSTTQSSTSTTMLSSSSTKTTDLASKPQSSPSTSLVNNTTTSGFQSSSAAFSSTLTTLKTNPASTSESMTTTSPTTSLTKKLSSIQTETLTTSTSSTSTTTLTSTSESMTTTSPTKKLTSTQAETLTTSSSSTSTSTSTSTSAPGLTSAVSKFLQATSTIPPTSSSTTAQLTSTPKSTLSSTVQTSTQTSTTQTVKPATLLSSKAMSSSSVSTSQSSSLSSKPTLLSSSPLVGSSSPLSSTSMLVSSSSTTKTSSLPVVSTAAAQQSQSTTQVSDSSNISLVNCTNSSSDLCNSCSKDFMRKSCWVFARPLVFDLSETEHELEIRLNTSKSLQELGKVECFLQKEDGNLLSTKAEAETNKIDVGFDGEFQDDTLLFLFCSIGGEFVVVNQTLLVASFQSLVEHKTPFVSGFDKDRMAHKSVLITFIKALPSPFSLDANSGAVCVLDGKNGKRYPAKWETPSIVSCELDSTIPAGSANVYTIRRRELEDATFQFQSPVSITITGGTGPTSTPAAAVKSAALMMDLLGINVQLGSNSGYSGKVFDCARVFLGAHSFGDSAVCSINGSAISIQFGSNATIVPADPLLIRAEMLAQNLSQPSSESATQYDVLMMTVPSEAISPQIELIQQSEFLPCVNAVNFSVNILKGDGKRSLTLTWILQSGGTDDLKKLFAQNSNSLLIPKESIGSGATFLVQACNFAAKCSNSAPLTVNISEKTSDFSVVISGCPATPLPAYKIVLEAEPYLKTCNKTVDLSNSNISYEWTINKTIATNDDILTIATYQYPPNTMIVVGLTAKYWNPDTAAFMEAETSQIIQFEAETLVPIVDGTERTISVLTELVMDARLSYDPNSGSRKLNHRWTCITSKGLNCDQLNLDWSLKRIVIPPNTLIAGERYTFTDTVSNDLGATASVAVNINVVQANIPSIQMLPLTESTIPTDGFLRVQAYIQSSTNLTIRWLLMKTATNQTVDISSLPNVNQMLEPDSSDSMYALSFTIPPHNETRYQGWAGLDPGQYLLRLTARNTDGSAFTDLKFQIVAKPPKPNLQASPLKDISALQTVMKLEAGGANDSAANSALYKFGVRTLLVGNKSEETWFRQSAIQSYKTILASAWPEPHAACNRRVGYQGMLQLCDLAGACTQTETDQFVVQHPLNQSFVLEHVLNDVMADMSTGDIDSALQKVRAVQEEQCNTTINSAIADVMIEKVLQDLQNTSNADEIMKGVGICTSVISSASSAKVVKVMNLLARAQTAMRSTPIEDRKKRSAADSISAMASLMTSGAPEANADAMLQAFDMTVQTNLDISTAYINNLLEQLSTFCRSVDSSRVMTAQGKDYTKIQAEGLTPDSPNFLNTSFSIALNVLNAIKFNKGFMQYFKSYKCGQNKLITCTDVCLATGETKKQILVDNGYIKSYFFPTDFNAATYNSLVSDFHYVLFEDTQLGEVIVLSNGINYTVSVPVNSYVISNYYSCFVFSKKYWDSSVCQSDEYATKSATNGYILGCTCTTAGIVAVFTMNPPVPPFYSPHNEILLKFNLSTTTACSAVQMSQFVSAISAATTITVNRFQNISCNAGTDVQTNPATIVVYLRPPFKEGQTDNSHAVQSIKRAVAVTGGLVAYAKVTITGVDAVTVHRTLQNDGRARKIPLRINKSFRDVVGNDTDGIIQKWTKSVAATIGVDIYRIKNAVVADGMIFNFTITLPYETSSTTEPMSAEELSLLVMEQTRYKELELFDNSDQSMPIDPLAFNEIVQLAVNSPTNSLMTILAVVVSTILLLSSAYVGGLVVLKIRTDRLIEAHNQNLRTVDINPNEPYHIVPFESNGMVWRNGIVTKEMDKAADTVVLGRQPVRTRHR